MKSYLFIAMLFMSGLAFAGGLVQGDKTENGNGPLQDHTCQGGNNCNTGASGGTTAVSGAIANADASATAGAIAQNTNNIAVGQETNIGVAVGVSNENVNLNSDYNSNTNLAYGGKGGDGGSAYAAGGDAEQKQGQEQSQGQNQGQSQSVSNSGNSANYNSQSNSGNNSNQSTSLNFESTGEARHYNKYGNNVSAYAPAIYSSSACTAGGLSGAVSGFGAGVSLGGAKQDPQCQVRENARILASLDANLALLYLCANPTVDVGKVLGSACKPADPIIVLPPQPEPPKPEVKPEIPVIDSKVKG
jgi:hypothetical protein